MSKIQDAIAELRHAPGVRGAAVVTVDGLTAAASLASGLDGEVIPGLTTYLRMTTNRILSQRDDPDDQKGLLDATHGKAVVVELDDSFLVVLFDQFAEISQADREVEDAVHRIRRASRLA